MDACRVLTVPDPDLRLSRDLPFRTLLLAVFLVFQLAPEPAGELPLSNLSGFPGLCHSRYAFVLTCIGNAERAFPEKVVQAYGDFSKANFPSLNSIFLRHSLICHG